MDQQQTPKIACVIANYNNQQFVCDAIASADVQDYPNKTIFITDDCSTDNSLRVIYDRFLGQGVIPHQIMENENFILCELHGKLSCPAYVFELKKNVGRGMVRNFSIDYALQAGHHLVQILDADDIMKPNKISTLASIVIQDPERIGIAYADYLIMNEQGLVKYESKPAFDLQLLMQGQNMIHSGAMINSLALKKVGLYRGDLAVAEDLNLWIRICQHFVAVHYPEALTIVRSHPQDSTRSVQKEIWERDYRRAITNT